MSELESTEEAPERAWRERAVSRSLNAARSRAEVRVQRFLDAAFELIDEKGTTEFTIQEVIDRSEQSLRGFYQHFDGKDELLLALFEETVAEATDDLRKTVEPISDPLDRLREFTIRLHEWCDPSDRQRKRSSHNRRPIMDFSVQLAADYSDRVNAAMAPISKQLIELIVEADAAGAIDVTDPREAAAVVQQTVMNSWFGNRLIQNAKKRLSAEAIWEFCRRGLGG
jgi:AcrR family transcriptional regulator